MSAKSSNNTVALNTTAAADANELFGDSKGCQHCDSDEFVLVEINGRAGSRKYVQACWDCCQDYREAPEGLYDPTAIGYTDDADYDGY